MIRRAKQDIDLIKKYLKIGDDGELVRIRKLKDGSIKYSKVKCKPNNYGYIILEVAKRNIRYHVAVWILSTGRDIPKGYEIDHINGNKLDNKIENLRLVTHRQNTQNMRCHREGCLLGVQYRADKRKWNPRIWINGKKISLGYYWSPKEAEKVYMIASKHVNEYTDNESFREIVKSKYNELNRA